MLSFITGKWKTSFARGQAGEGDSSMANNIVDLFAANPHAAFYINGDINSYTVHFMVDIVSILDTKTFDKIKGNSTLEPLDWGHLLES